MKREREGARERGGEGEGGEMRRKQKNVSEFSLFSFLSSFNAAPAVFSESRVFCACFRRLFECYGFLLPC